MVYNLRLQESRVMLKYDHYNRNDKHAFILTRDSNKSVSKLLKSLPPRRKFGNVLYSGKLDVDKDVCTVGNDGDTGNIGMVAVVEEEAGFDALDGHQSNPDDENSNQGDPLKPATIRTLVNKPHSGFHVHYGALLTNNATKTGHHTGNIGKSAYFLFPFVKIRMRGKLERESADGRHSPEA